MERRRQYSERPDRAPPERPPVDIASTAMTIIVLQQFPLILRRLLVLVRDAGLGLARYRSDWRTQRELAEIENATKVREARAEFARSRPPDLERGG